LRFYQYYLKFKKKMEMIMPEKKEVILITGCSGRIGFKAAERFSEKYQIVGFDIFLAGHLPNVEFLTVDIGSDESIKEGLDKIKAEYGSRIASVIHLAAYYSFTEEHSPNYERITVKGTERLLRHLQDFQVEQFIFSSTVLVFAPCKVGERVDEHSRVEAKWAYPQSKVETEQLIHRERGHIPTVIFRIAGVYDDRCHSIPLSHQIQRIYENQLTGHLFAGNIHHGAPFVHMDDLIEALWLTVEKRHSLPQESLFVIGEPDTMSYDELQRAFSRLIYGVEWRTFSLPKTIAKFGAWLQDHTPFVPKSFIKPWMIDLADDHCMLDISHVRQELGWQPKYSLRKKVKKMIIELKQDPLSWYDENKLKPPISLLKRRD
jgi:nucleoside-diphosphate-sugar epimerase